MAKNDIILIDGIIEDRVREQRPSCDKGEVFEYLASEQILKSYDLSREELENGCVDGRNDGGIDAFYIFVNGILLENAKDFFWPKNKCDIQVIIITCKHQNTFTQPVVNSQYATVCEIFDLTKDEESLVASYNSELLAKRKLFKEAYYRTASNLSSLNFNFYCVSRGDTEIIDENIKSRADLIGKKITEFYSKCNYEYEFIGTSELLALYRCKPIYELNLNHKRIISYNDECHVVLVTLKDYYNFITDESGKLRKYLFDSNVRDFMGANSVNEDILSTLQGDKIIDFWWLNNGITILASSAINLGQFLQIRNVQIVNGLQTSQTIYNYVKSGANIDDDERCIMIKIVSQNDASIRDLIICSTNNQTAIQPKSLFATDKKQRDIEEIMKKYGWYYERRTNCYANQDINQEQIVDIMYVAAGYTALILKNFRRAAIFKQKYLKNEKFYNEIFNETDNLTIWPKITEILRKIDLVLLESKSIPGNECALKRTRFLIASIAVSRLLNTFNWGTRQLLSVDISLITKAMILEIWNTCLKAKYDKKIMKQNAYINGILEDASKLWNIPNVDSIVKHKK